MISLTGFLQTWILLWREGMPDPLNFLVTCQIICAFTKGPFTRICDDSVADRPLVWTAPVFSHLETTSFYTRAEQVYSFCCGWRSSLVCKLWSRRPLWKQRRHRHNTTVLLAILPFGSELICINICYGNTTRTNSHWSPLFHFFILTFKLMI